MIPEEDFEKIKESMDEFDKNREEVIKKSRSPRKRSKKAIYSIHRGEIEKAEELLEKAEEELKTLFQKIEKNQDLRTGSYSSAVEEYIEARTFLEFIQNHKIPSFSIFFFADEEEYLGALSDLTGELARKAVREATDRNIEEVERMKEIIDNLYGEFVKFDFRNGKLRKKYDSIKYNLQKVEDTLYDLKVKS